MRPEGFDTMPAAGGGPTKTRVRRRAPAASVADAQAHAQAHGQADAQADADATRPPRPRRPRRRRPRRRHAGAHAGPVGDNHCRTRPGRDVGCTRASIVRWSPQRSVEADGESRPSGHPGAEREPPGRGLWRAGGLGLPASHGIPLPVRPHPTRRRARHRRRRPASPRRHQPRRRRSRRPPSPHRRADPARSRPTRSR